MIIGAIGALVFQFLKWAFGCLIMGIMTVVIVVVFYGVIQVLTFLPHLFG